MGMSNRDDGLRLEFISLDKASTRVLARLIARFASIVCLSPSAFKLVHVISRVCCVSCGLMSLFLFIVGKRAFGNSNAQS